jgi:hypothetical protein
MPDATRNFAVSSRGRSRADGGNGKSARYIPVGNGFANGVVMGNGQVPSNSSRNHFSNNALLESVRAALER